jgi:competence protein ComEC
MAEDNTRNPVRIRQPAVQIAALRAPHRPLLGLRSFPWGEWLGRNLEVERDQRRFFPCLAICFGLGILLFFQAEGRPALWAPLAAVILCGAGAFLARNRAAAGPILLAATALFAGFAAGVLRVRAVEAPVLTRTVITRVSGHIEGIEARLRGARLLVRVAEIGGVPDSERPLRARISVRDASGLAPGLFVAGTARLLPPPQPAWPGGYDFARDAWFRGIGAVGSFVGRIEHSPSSEPDWSLRIAGGIDDARNALTQRIAEAIGGPAGGVAAALITGKRGLIPDETNDVLRGAGIYHIVSISGLHMVLAAGTFFWLTRALLALSPALALLWPVKKIAAVGGMLGGIAYCIFSGSEVATERSLIMTMVMFGAILADRPALSIRNLAVAALIVLAREPEALIGPSFQMSFGAVAALIAAAPLLNGRWGDGQGRSSVEKGVRWLIRAVVGLAATTVVATIATAPFSAYHFQTLNPLGLIGNALALPLVSIAVMPAALLGVLAYPFGLDRPVWQVMGLAVKQVVDISAFVSGLDGSTLLVPAVGSGAFALLALALLLTTVPASSLRWLAVLPASLGLAFAATPVRPDIFVDREGKGAAVRGPGGQLVLLGKPSDFIVEQWLRADGDRRDPDDPSLRTDAWCDPLGCTVPRPGGRRVALVLDASAFDEDCRRAAVVITPLSAPPWCQAGTVIDRPALKANGAMTIRFTPEPVITPTFEPGDPRPWTPPHPHGASAPAKTPASPAPSHQ